MWFFVENRIPVSKLGWETRHTVKFGLFGGPLFTWDFPIIGSIVKKFCRPEKIRPARHFLWRKPKKTVPRPFIDVFFRGELDSGVEIGVGNPAHGQIWAFLGTTFHLRFFQHRVNRKKILCPWKNSSRQPLFMKEAEKNPSENLYRCDFAWRIGFRCWNWGEKPSTQSNLGFFGDHSSLVIFPT